jgi:hypothetical protein
MARIACLALLILPLPAFADDPNTWRKVTEGQIGPRSSAPLVYLPTQKAFTLLGGYISHEPQGPFPFDLLTFDPASATWKNWFSGGTADRGKEVGPVRDPGFKSPYFELVDKEGALRLSPRQARFYNQYAFAPWDGCVYALVCGHTLRFDPRTQAWTDLAPKTAPVTVQNNYRQALCWGALCADPVNRELVLVGGCGADNQNASPGTWIYSTGDNEWRRLGAKIEPGPRALAPMAYDADARAIVLFGGDRLNELLGDTWVYDCASRSWQQRRPAINPAPRFGHGLVAHGSKGVILVGGKTYTSSNAYLAMLYAPLPFEMWTYDVKADRWTRLKTQGRPPQIANAAMMAAINDKNELMLVKESQGKLPAETWTCQLSTAAVNDEGTKMTGVAPGTSVFRTGAYDPAWYDDLPAADEKAFAKFLADVPANRFVDVEAPRWPLNRQGGGWSTSALDIDNEQILNVCGGHSSYFGNDVAHFSLKTGRWLISARPELALDFNYDLSGPGPLTFAGAPWSNHNYKTYAYDPLSKRMILVGGQTHFYDPAARRWRGDERFATSPFAGSKYVTFICPTPHGVYVWTRMTGFSSEIGLFRLDDNKAWSRVKTTGAPLPRPVVDAGSTIVYDTQRDRFLLTTVEGLKPGEAPGQLWSIDRKTGECSMLNPQGRDKLVTPRFAREAVYVAKQDVFLFGILIGDGLQTPFYLPESNTWQLANIPGAEVMNSHRKQPGGSVDLGLLYDAKRDLVYAVLCPLRPGALRVLRVDAAAWKK